MTVAEHRTSGTSSSRSSANSTRPSGGSGRPTTTPCRTPTAEASPAPSPAGTWCAKYQRYAKDYLACIEAVDESVGRILDFIDELGIAEDTIVVYRDRAGTSANTGGTTSDGCTRRASAFILRWPGRIEPGTTTGIMSQNIDLAFLEVAGVEAPARMQGRSLAGFLEQGAVEVPEDWRDALYYHFYESCAPTPCPSTTGSRPIAGS